MPLITLIVIPIVLIVATVLGLSRVEPLRLAAIVAAGRSPNCPIANAIDAPNQRALQIRYKDEILAASKKLTTDGAFEQWQTPMGTYWIPSGSRYVLPFNLAEQKREIYKGLEKGDVVLDCGANVGVFTRHALERGASKVIAIEIAPENLEVLRRNFAAEIADGRVVVYPKGVWDKDEMLTLNVDPTNSAGDSVVIQQPNAQASIQVPLTTIDKLVAELGLDRVDFIKMDIEGAEQPALRGARETIRRYKPRMALSAYHLPEDALGVPATVLTAEPGYVVTCGPCEEQPGFRITPDILYFRPR